MFERGESVRIVPWTFPGCHPRLANGFVLAAVQGFSMVRREVTIKPIALFGRPYKVPEAAVVPPCQGGGAELKSRGRHQSSEATRTINGLSRQAEKPTKQLGQARVQSERAAKEAKPPLEQRPR